MAITAIMPSLCDTILHLISFEGVELYIKDVPGSVSVADDLKRQSSSLPVLDARNRRLYISESEDAIGNTGNSDYKLKKPLPDKKFTPCVINEKSKILIIGSNNKLGYILESLLCFKNEFPDFRLKVVLMDTAQNEERIRKYVAAPEYSPLFEDKESGVFIVNDIFDPFTAADGGSVLKVYGCAACSR